MKFALMTLALLAPLASAYHSPVGRCDGSGVALGSFQAGDGTAERTVYIDDRNQLLGSGIWLYQESNGIFTPYAPVTVTLHVQPPTRPPTVQYWWVWLNEVARVDVEHDLSGSGADHNLQRGGGSVMNPYLPDEYDDNEICTDDPSVAPDTLIF